jgi:hypothetical protein
MQILSVLRVPVYRLSAPEAFNRLLGIGGWRPAGKSPPLDNSEL